MRQLLACLLPLSLCSMSSLAEDRPNRRQAIHGSVATCVFLAAHADESEPKLAPKQRMGLELVRQGVQAYIKNLNPRDQAWQMQLMQQQTTVFWQQVQQRLMREDDDAGVITATLHYHLCVSSDISIRLAADYLIRYDGWIDAVYNGVATHERRVTEIAFLNQDSAQPISIEARWTGSGPVDQEALVLTKQKLERAFRIINLN